jgi:hypothetical protein
MSNTIKLPIKYREDLIKSLEQDIIERQEFINELKAYDAIDGYILLGLPKSMNKPVQQAPITTIKASGHSGFSWYIAIKKVIEERERVTYKELCDTILPTLPDYQFRTRPKHLLVTTLNKLCTPLGGNYLVKSYENNELVYRKKKYENVSELTN